MKTIKRKDYAPGIERDVMGAIVMAVKNSKTTEDRVQLISQEYLTIADEPMVEVMVRKLREMGKKFQEIREVAETYWAKFIKDKGRIALTRTHIYIKNGNIEKALITAKGGTNYV